MKGRVVGGTIAEEGHTDVVGAAGTCADAGSHRRRQPSPDQAVGAKQPAGRVVQMHGATTATAAPIPLAIQLGHQGVGRHALGQRMAMATVGAGDPVGLAQVRAHAHPGCLLADVQMQETGRLALAAGHLRREFESAQQQHLLVKTQQFIAREAGGQRRSGGGGGAGVHRVLNFQKSREKPAVQPPSTVSTWPVM